MNKCFVIKNISSLYKATHVIWIADSLNCGQPDKQKHVHDSDPAYIMKRRKKLCIIWLTLFRDLFCHISMSPFSHFRFMLLIHYMKQLIITYFLPEFDLKVHSSMYNSLMHIDYQFQHCKRVALFWCTAHNKVASMLRKAESSNIKSFFGWLDVKGLVLACT